MSEIEIFDEVLDNLPVLAKENPDSVKEKISGLFFVKSRILLNITGKAW